MAALLEAITNAHLVERAQRVIPGGVNSGNRAIANMPLVVREAHGAYFTDVEGKTYLDYHAAFGPIILGHNHPRVREAVCNAATQIDLIGVGVTEMEIALAEKIAQYVPSAEQVLLANSGSEATYQALRLARAVTGRQDIIKFQGTYHGWHDAVAMNVISPADRVGTGERDLLSAGMMPGVVEHTHILPFNDVEAITDFMERRGESIAAILVEVIPHNIGCVLPRPGFLQTLRDLCDTFGCLLIFDEVVTGFRHDLGGYQKIIGVTPDLSTFAKAMANGYPIAALVGKAKYMQRYAPGGDVFFAGTYNGHPHSVAAALATIAELEDGSIHARCFALAERAADGIQQIANELGIPMTVVRFGSVFVPYFMEGPIVSYGDLLRNDTARDVWFRSQMCARGVFMLPVALKRNHVSATHTSADIDRTLEAAWEVLRELEA